MAYAPIMKVLVPITDTSGDPYSGAVLKAYQDGTSTVLSMATDYTGGTTASSIALDSSGYPSVSGNIVIPHVDQDYKLSLYPTQTDADANTNAIWTIDTLPFGSIFTTMTSHDKSEVTYVENDAGSGSTTFDIDANISTAWESVGPTGSGATNIWTAMDNIPDGAKWVELKFLNRANDSTGAAIEQYVYIRATGSSTATGNQTMASVARVAATGSTATEVMTLNTVKVPVDSSKRFDIYFTADGTSRVVDCYLVGTGV